MATTPVFLPENPKDRWTWWTIVHGVSKNQTWLKRLSRHTWIYILLNHILVCSLCLVFTKHMRACTYTDTHINIYWYITIYMWWESRVSKCEYLPWWQASPLCFSMKRVENHGPLISYSCCNRLSWAYWLKPMQIYYLQILEPKSLKWVWKSEKQNVGKAGSSGGSREEFVSLSFPPSRSHQFMTPSSHHIIFFPLFPSSQHLLPLLYSNLPLVRKLVVIFKHHGIIIQNNLPISTFLTTFAKSLSSHQVISTDSRD